MEDLLRSLRNLGLAAPDPSQLWQLLDDDPEVQKRLIKLLAFNVDQSVDGDGNGSNERQEDAGMSMSAASFMGQELLQEAVVGVVDNFRQSIDRQRAIHLRESTIMREKRDEAKVKRIKLAPRKALLARQEAALRKAKDQSSFSKTYRPRLVYDGNTSFHSERGLDELKQVGCSDLDGAPKRFASTYLLCRVITPLLMYVGVTFMVEDPAGVVVPVSVSHFTGNANMTCEQASVLLPMGTILAIKEPFLSIDHQARVGPCASKGDVGIRIDSPTDIVVLDGQSQLASETEWQTSLSNLSRADVPWLRDTVCPDADHAGLAKRLYDQRRMGAAFRSVNRAKHAQQPIDPLLEARILFHLGAWQEAQEKFALLPSAPSDQQARERASDEKAAKDHAIPIERLSSEQAILRCGLRSKQAIQGLSMDDVRSIYFAAATHVSRFDTSDYIGPVAVQDIPGAGRGLVTTRDVEPGELVFCCRAVGSAYPDDEESKGSPIVRLNLDNGVVSATSQIRAQTNLIHAIADRPELAHSVLGLTAGPGVAYNAFASRPSYPTITRPVLDSTETLKYTCPSIDAQYIDGVLRFNAFGPAQSPTRGGPRTDAGELSKSTMPHPLPAILNHACLPNVASIFFSDIVTSRALLPLPKGTEIVHQYVRGEEPYAIRSAQLSKHGFECGCDLCIADRADGKEAYTQRARIIQGELGAVQERSRVLMKSVKLDSIGSPGNDGLANDVLDAHRDVIASLMHLLHRVHSTYAPSRRSSLRPDMFIILDIVIKHFLLIDVEKAKEALIRAVECVGGQIDLEREPSNDNKQGVLVALPRLHMDGIIGLLLLMAVYEMNRKRRSIAVRYAHAAFWSHQSMIGGGMDVFRDRWLVAEFEGAFTLFSLDEESAY